MILPSMRCSMTCAHQPEVREITKSGVNIARRHAHHVVARGAVPVEVREHLLLAPHHLLDARRRCRRASCCRRPCERRAGDLLDDLVARVGDRVDRVAEADDRSPSRRRARRCRPRPRPGCRSGRWISKATSLAPPCFGPLQRADGAGDGGVHVGAGAGDDARGEGGGVELVLGVEDERGVHGAHPQRPRASCRAAGAGNGRRWSRRRSRPRCAGR